MDLDHLREYCLSKPHVTEGFPFNEDALVFKVGSKMFCLTNINLCVNMNLKCDPEKSAELREEHEEITPGFHMNKKHWNTVSLMGNLSNQLLEELVDDSYNLVVQSMTKKERISLNFDN